MRVSTRFEVFKRDGFTCQYCGRKTPDVVLEADHVIPRAEGGGDEIENLVTACWDCNRGKGAVPLDEHRPVADLAEQMEVLREREAQLRAYHGMRNEIVDRREDVYHEVRNYWFDVWGATDLPRWHIPYDNVMRNAIEKLGPSEVMAAMDAAGRRFDYISTDACRYFGGIIKNKIAENEGRVVECPYCHERMVLTREQFAESPTGWYHTRCKKEAE